MRVYYFCYVFLTNQKSKKDYVSKISNKNEYSFVTSIAIYDITEKIHEDEFYLTVALGDCTIEEYNLPYDKLTLRASERIYDEVVVNSGFIGVSLEITIPYNQPKSDIGMILKEKHTDYCEIIAVTTKNNVLID